MFNFNRLINSTFKSNYPIKYIPKTGSYVEGKYVTDTTLPITLSGSCQNLSGKDLKLLPENIRSEASRQLFTTVEILVDSDVEYRGKRYKVLTSDPYDDIQDSGHWKSVLKLYSKGYNNETQETVTQPDLEPLTPPPHSNGGQYINGVWTDD